MKNLIETQKVKTYFLRYTEEAKQDLERNESYHNSDYKAGSLDWLEGGQEEEFVAEVFGCEVDEIKVAEDGYYVQVLHGLCGFELEAKDLEEAIAEAKGFRYNSVYNFENNNWSIFEGNYIDYNIEGCLFKASKIAYTN